MNWEEEYKNLLADIELIDKILCLGDHIYDVREREGEGWEGKNVIAYGEAVSRIEKRIQEKVTAARSI